MLFNSLQFAAFFPFVTAVYFMLRHRDRWKWLLVASCYFYMAFVPIYIAILAAEIVIDYCAALMLERSSGRARKALLWLSVLSTSALLLVFKYLLFATETLNSMAAVAGWSARLPAVHLILPIGLSFHTFQSLSYVIEVYRGNHPAERHLGIYALYVMFFPQLVAGPIERPGNLIWQFRKPHNFEYARVADGIQLMAWGLFKKLVIADRAAAIVNVAYDDPMSHNGIQLLVATIFFAFQIYCDFSGYSDIAIGAARVLGFRLMQNFDRPYSSRSIAEFWRRWHISLSTWFRDYVYIPLGGSRVSDARRYLNLMTVFLLSGLWHGANWTFVAWGAIHGLYMSVALATDSMRRSLKAAVGLASYPRLDDVLRRLITFGLVTLAWIPFRARSLGETMLILQKIMGDVTAALRAVAEGRLEFVRTLVGELRFGRDTVVLTCTAILVLEIVQYLQQGRNLSAVVSGWPRSLRWAARYALVISLLYLSPHSGGVPFIYFQF